VFEQSLVNDQPILHTSLRKPVRTDLLLCDRWQTQAHPLAAKRSDINTIKKKIINVKAHYVCMSYVLMDSRGEFTRANEIAEHIIQVDFDT